MHLLYLDDSGSSKNPTEEYLVLGGVSVSEAQVHFLTEELDKLAETINPADPQGVEFHASEIFARRNAPWKTMTKDEALGVIKSVLTILTKAYDSAKIFACAIHKKSYSTTPDLMEMAFEDQCKRFDMYLDCLRGDGDRQRGIIIFDESSHETSIQNLATNFRKKGTAFGSIHNLAETPLFVNSKAARLVQLADHVAYSVFRRYNTGDTRFFDLIVSKFYTRDNVIHGLAHKQLIDPHCMCPACMSRH